MMNNKNPKKAGRKPIDESHPLTKAEGFRCAENVREKLDVIVANLTKSGFPTNKSEVIRAIIERNIDEGETIFLEGLRKASA